MGGAGQFDVPGPGNDFVPPQELLGTSTQFQFVPGQLAPIASTGLPRSQRPRMPRAQTMPHHTDPQQAQNLHFRQTSSMRLPSQAHLPLQEACQPPPSFPQQHINPGHTFYSESSSRGLKLRTYDLPAGNLVLRESLQGDLATTSIPAVVSSAMYALHA
jgi:hypothetical protein